MLRIEIEEFLLRRTKRWYNRSDLDKDPSGDNDDIANVIITALKHIDIDTASLVAVTQAEIDKATNESLFLNLCEYFLLDLLSQYVCGESYQAVGYRVETSSACNALQSRMERVKGYIDQETDVLQQIETVSVNVLDLQIDQEKPIS